MLRFSFLKQVWDFFREALEVMCGELQMTGVLVATKDKQGLAASTCGKSTVCYGIDGSFISDFLFGFFDYWIYK